MAKIKTYSVTHNMPRTNAVYANAIARLVNNVTASNGGSLCRDRVQEELDSICDPEKQAEYGFEILESETERLEYDPDDECLKEERGTH